MIEGITVLSQHYISDTAGNIALLALITLCFILALFVILYSLKTMKKQDKSAGFIKLLFLLPIIEMIMICSIGYNENTSYTEYKVTIDEKVNLKEFSEKYEIIGQDGKIYTIVKKEND